MSTGGRWAGVPALVTGAQGFVGSWLVERLLAEGANVVVPRRPPRPSRFYADGLAERCEHADVDLLDRASVLGVLEEHDIRAVFHLASQPIADVAERSPYPTWELNVRGTWTILEACRTAREGGGAVERIVAASSARAYGPALDRPFREEDALAALDPHGTSKAAADLIARSYAATHALPVGTLRMANVYGGGDLSYSRLVPGACRALVEGERPVLLSDGTPEREVLHVEDAVDALLSVAASLDELAHAGRAWNVGSGEAPPVLDVVRRLVAASGVEVEPDVRGRPRGVVDRAALDSSGIREALGWSPAWDLDRGLPVTYEWYRAHLALARSAGAAPGG